MSIEISVYFSDSGLKRTFSFDDPTNVRILKEAIRRKDCEPFSESPNSLNSTDGNIAVTTIGAASDDNLVLLDASGSELKDSQFIKNTTNVFFYSIAETPLLPIYPVGASPPQVPVFSAENISDSAKLNTPQQFLFEYAKIFRQWGATYAELRKQIRGHCHMLSNQSSSLMTSFQKLDSGLSIANSNFNNELETLLEKLETLKNQIENVAPLFRDDFEKLQKTQLPSHFAEKFGQAKLIDLFRNKYTDKLSNLQEQCSTIEDDSQARYAQTLDFQKEYKSQTTPMFEELVPIPRVNEPFDALQKSFNSVQSLIGEIDTAAEKYARLVQHILENLSDTSASSASSASASVSLLDTCLELGTIDQLRHQAPPFTNSIVDKLQEAQQQYEVFFHKIQYAIEGRLWLFVGIRKLYARKKIRIDLFERIQKQFEPIREIHLIVEAYENLLPEINRRNNFQADLTGQANNINREIQQLVEKEVLNRTSFATKYHNLLRSPFLEVDLSAQVSDFPKFTPMAVDFSNENPPATSPDDKYEQPQFNDLSSFTMISENDSSVIITATATTTTTTTTSSSNSSSTNSFENEDLPSITQLRSHIESEFLEKIDQLENEIKSLKAQMLTKDQNIEELTKAAQKLNTLQVYKTENEHQSHIEILQQQQQQQQQQHIPAEQEDFDNEIEILPDTDYGIMTLPSTDGGALVLQDTDDDDDEEIVSRDTASKSKSSQDTDDEVVTRSDTVDEVAILTIKYKTLEERHDSIRDARNMYIQKCKSLEETNKTLSSELTKLKEELENITSERNVLNSELESDRQSIVELKSELTEETRKWTQSKLDNDKIHAQLNEAQYTIASLKEKCEQKEKEAQKANEEAYYAKGKLSACQRTVALRDAEIASLNTKEIRKTSSSQNLNAQSDEKQQQHTAPVSEQTRNELASLKQELANTKSQLMKAHEQTQQAKTSFSICAGGLYKIAVKLNLNAHANSIHAAEQSRSPIVNEQDVCVIVDEFTRFIEETISSKRSLTIALSDFIQGDIVLFLPLPGTKQIYYAVCQDPAAPPSFLNIEASPPKSAPYLIGEFFHEDTITAFPNNPYQLSEGAKFKVVQARIF